MADKITPRAENYSDWYVNVVTQAKLADYSPVKGCMIIRPNGYAIWEKIQATLDRMFKETGHVNAYFPMLIPESFIRREKAHVEGFAPELAVVTHGGGEKLDEPLVIRPTSETIIWDTYRNWIQSYRDLPLLINQWANVMRWEKRTRLFLRTAEFLWQEGHTAHANEAEAREETLRMLEVYKRFAEEWLAIPVLTGVKSESEKFAGAVDTYCIEAMMQDKRALQAGTSHFLGQNFAKAFEVQFQNKEGKLEYVWATSWGVSTRLIGALIMAHSDDNGLVLPPRIAPTQVVIVPIFKTANKDQVLSFAAELKTKIMSALGTAEFEPRRVILDDNENSSPGWKFAEWELQGVPVRVELGARDIEAGTATIYRRDTKTKVAVPIDQIPAECARLMVEIQSNMLTKARDFQKNNTVNIDSFEALKELFSGEGGGGFAKVAWAGNAGDEKKIKEQTKATIRCLPFGNEAEANGKVCFYTGKPATNMAIFAKAY